MGIISGFSLIRKEYKDESVTRVRGTFFRAV